MAGSSTLQQRRINSPNIVWPILDGARPSQGGIRVSITTVNCIGSIRNAYRCTTRNEIGSRKQSMEDIDSDRPSPVSRCHCSEIFFRFCCFQLPPPRVYILVFFQRPVRAAGYITVKAASAGIYQQMDFFPYELNIDSRILHRLVLKLKHGPFKCRDGSLGDLV